MRHARKYVTIYEWKVHPVKRTRGLLIKVMDCWYEYIGQADVPNSFVDFPEFVKRRYHDAVWRKLPRTDVYTESETGKRTYHVSSKHSRFAIYPKNGGGAFGTVGFKKPKAANNDNLNRWSREKNPMPEVLVDEVVVHKGVKNLAVGREFILRPYRNSHDQRIFKVKVTQFFGDRYTLDVEIGDTGRKIAPLYVETLSNVALFEKHCAYWLRPKAPAAPVVEPILTEGPSQMSNRPTTLVTVAVPPVKATKCVHQLGAGVIFTCRRYPDALLMRTDRTVSGGYICVNLKNGVGANLPSDTPVEEYYKQATITVQ